MAEYNDLPFSAASPHIRPIVKIAKAPCKGFSKFICRVPKKYHPGQCKSTNKKAVIMFAIENDTFCLRADKTAPRIKNSSKTGAIITASKKENSDR